MNRDRYILTTLVPYIWLLIFFLAPFLIVLKISLSTVTLGQPLKPRLLQL